MQVWRIQHNCTHPHGPLGSCPDDKPSSYNSYPRPRYGCILEEPTSFRSGISHIMIEQHFIFGTLQHQFSKWWESWYDENTNTHYSYDSCLENNWWAVLYDVEDEACHIGVNQVMFDSYRCVEVMRTQTDYPRGNHEVYSSNQGQHSHRHS